MIEYDFKNELFCDTINITSSKSDNNYLDLFFQGKSIYPREEVTLTCIENTENNKVVLSKEIHKIVFLKPDEVKDNNCISTKKMTLTSCSLKRDFSNNLNFGFFYHFKGTGKDYSEAEILLSSQEDILSNSIGEEFVIKLL